MTIELTKEEACVIAYALGFYVGSPLHGPVDNEHRFKMANEIMEKLDKKPDAAGLDTLSERPGQKHPDNPSPGERPDNSDTRK